jgi:lysophospholipase L1-like esterase
MRDLPRLLASGTPLDWVFTGDSITHGLHHTRGGRGYVEHVAERLRGELRRVGDVVVNTGVAGWTAEDLLARLEHHALRFRPHVASVAVGMNDAVDGEAGRSSFCRCLAAVVGRLQQSGAVVVVHTPTTTGPGALTPRPDLPAYADVCRDVAARSGALLVDHHAHWSERSGHEAPAAWLDDPIHPNGRGQWEMARLTLRTLGLDDPAGELAGLSL